MCEVSVLNVFSASSLSASSESSVGNDGGGGGGGGGGGSIQSTCPLSWPNPLLLLKAEKSDPPRKPL